MTSLVTCFASKIKDPSHPSGTVPNWWTVRSRISGEKRFDLWRFALTCQMLKPTQNTGADCLSAAALPEQCFGFELAPRKPERLLARHLTSAHIGTQSAGFVAHFYAAHSYGVTSG